LVKSNFDRIMEHFDTYISSFLSNYTDVRVKKNATSLLEKMKLGQSTQLWSLSSDPNKYERNRSDSSIHIFGFGKKLF
jgi:hypothetical protein